MYQYKLISVLLLLISCISYSQEATENTQNFTNDEVNTTLNDTVKNKKGEVLQEVIVIGNHQKKPLSATRSGIKPMDLPQSLQVVDNEIISQQQSIRLSDVVKNINGVYVGSARGGAQESFFSRGYDMSANNMFKNGFRFNSGSIPEVSSLEKVEVLKGSAALLYGNVAPGGILNMVSKAPSFKRGGEVGMQIGSYSFYKPSIDFYGPLSKNVAYRFVGSYENSDSFRDVVKKERYYINPSLLFKTGERTEILLQGDYLHDNWTPDFGTGIIGKEIVDLPRNTYLGATWSNGQTRQTTVSALVTHEIDNNWKLNLNTSFQNYSRTSKGTERMVILPETVPYGNYFRPLGQNKNLEQILGEQISLQGNFTTGTIKHQLFTGVDFEKSLAEAYTYKFLEVDEDGDLLYPGGNYDEINIFDFDPNTQNTVIPTGTATKIVKTTTDRFGVYAQDLISFTDKFKVLAGLRWSWQEAQIDTQEIAVATTSFTPKRKDTAFSPKLGFVYQPTKQMSLFASYANSFSPNSGTTVSGESIEASIIDQYEVGVKKDFLKGLLSTNVTLYQITNSNLAQTAEFKADGTLNTNTAIKVLSGSTKSKGVEIDVTAKPVEGLNITAGYSYNDMRYTKTSGTNGSFIVGDRLVRTPATTANLSFFYTQPSGVLKGISFGALANYIGDRKGGWNDNYVVSNSGAVSITDREIPLEGYTTIDLSAGYSWEKFAFLCKLSNVGNVLNYTVHENYSVNPTAPRQVMASVKYKF